MRQSKVMLTTPSIPVPLRILILTTALSSMGCSDENSSSKPDESLSYSLSATNQVDTVSRSRWDGYDLDDISIKKVNETSIQLINHTPRFLANPLLMLNHSLFKVEQSVQPFEVITLELPQHIMPLSTAQYVEEQPFFKAQVAAYVDPNESSDTYSEPTLENIDQYEKELRGLKNVLNNYTYSKEFVYYIEEYMSATTSQTQLTKEQLAKGQWCELHQTTHSLFSLPSSGDFAQFKANDTSSNSDKHLSYMIHKPSARYGMLNSGGWGQATIADGWLAVRDFRLPTEGAVAPKDTFLHEKMHNHGFNHSGGMTYGYPAQITNFVSQYWGDNFYQLGAVEQETPSLAVFYQTQASEEGVKIAFEFVDKQADSDSSKSIDQFLLVVTDSLMLKSAEHIDSQQVTTRLNADK